MDNNSDQKKKENTGLKTEPETLNTPDPQDEMKGPVSSLVKGAKENIEENNESKAAADKKKDENM